MKNRTVPDGAGLVNLYAHGLLYFETVVDQVWANARKTLLE
jgi:hypothetical protein